MSFQVVLVTDSRHSYGIFNYHPCDLGWDLDFLSNRNILQGFSCGRSGGRDLYLPLQSAAGLRAGAEWGNTGRLGRWIYALDTLGDGFVNPRLECRNWHAQEERNQAFYNPFIFHTCPCSQFQAFFDSRYSWIPNTYYLPLHRIDQCKQTCSPSINLPACPSVHLSALCAPMLYHHMHQS